MCGVAGIFEIDHTRPIDPDRIERMCAAMHHRGPDDGGRFVEPGRALGHRRLSIIGLEGGRQPLGNEDDSVVTVFNGEIYNHRELRRDLEARGHTFRTDTDTEVIVHLYEEHGDAFVEHLDGMFAIAVVDRRRHRLVLVRDRVGIKPLYIERHEGSIAFASEIKALLAGRIQGRDLDLRAVHRFLTFGYLPGRETLLRGVEKLEPGERLVVADGRISRDRWWVLDHGNSSFGGSFDDAVDAFGHHLDAAVESHLQSDVPVGVLLSGGLDSSLVLEAATRTSGSEIPCFTVGFEGADVPDERPWARIAAEACRGRPHEITVRPEEFEDFLPDYVRFMEEPVCEAPAVALHQVSRLAREHVTVVLSGEGGDECFAGYRNHLDDLRLAEWRARLGLLGHAAARLGLPAGGTDRARRIREALSMPLDRRYLGRTAGPWRHFSAMPADWFTPAFRAASDADWSTGPARNRWTEARANGCTDLQGMLSVDTATWLPDDLLLKADKMTMAASIELRVPFLDRSMLEFAASVPDALKLHGGRSKAIVRALAARRLPARLVDRPKAGFPIPYGAWFRGRLEGYVRDTLLDRNARIHEIVTPAGIESILTQHRHGRGRPREVLALLVLEHWMQSFLGGAPASMAEPRIATGSRATPHAAASPDTARGRVAG